MKKNFLCLFAILLAFGFSAFTSAKKSSSTSDLYIFRLFAAPTGSNLSNTTTIDGIQVYQGWTFEGIEEDEFVQCATGEERACTLIVSPDYAKTIPPTGIRLLASDPDGSGEKKAFPMTVENGLFVSPTQYKKINITIEIINAIDVKNGTVN
jgi:hypothetical protein